MSMISGVLALCLESLMEFDEVHHERLPDGKMKVVFVTTGMNPRLTEIKTRIWSTLNLPVQRVESCNVEELQGGTILKRYRVTVTLKPPVKLLRRAS